MSTRGKDRILFASDYPGAVDASGASARPPHLDLTDEVRHAWLYDNANAFFFGG